jgi:hypothetical protein
VASFIASLDVSGLPDLRTAIYHQVDLETGETMREALGALDVLVAKSPSKDTPIFFDILGATSREQFEAAGRELEEHCRKRGYNLVGLPGWPPG